METRAAVSHSHSGVPLRRRPLGELLVREGLISPGQLQEALREQAELTTYAPLGQILVHSNVITEAQLNLVLDKHHKRARLGDLLVEAGVITQEQLATALEHQRQTGSRLGDVFVQLNFVTEPQMKEALCKQFQVPFVDLDTLALDQGLTQYLSRAYSNHHGVIPIAKLGDRLTIAIEDPAATEVIEDLRAATGCRIDVVTATGAAIDRARARLYETSGGGVFVKALQRAESDRATHEGTQRAVEHDMARALSELRSGQKAILQLHETLVGHLADLQRLQAEVGQAIEDLRASQDRLVKDHEGVAATAAWLRDRHVSIDQQILALHEAATANRQDGETIRQALQDLATRQQAALLHITELRSSQAAPLAPTDVASDALREVQDQHRALVQDRQDTASRIEAVLRRLTQDRPEAPPAG
jgi:hypothetical protein